MKNHIYLYGPSGSGKSTAGRLLADDLNLRFVDLDSRIENSTGMDISKIMQTHGENYFRELETRELLQLGDEASVVALGGGALLRKENREFAEGAGDIVFLDAKLGVIIDRLQTDTEKRPLLDGDLRQALEQLLEKRSDHYRSFKIRVDANGNLPDVVWRIKTTLGVFRLKAMGSGYDVRIEKGLRHQIGKRLNARGLKGPIMLVSDENVMALYGEDAADALKSAGYKTEKFTLSSGEENKTIHSVTQIWESALEAGLERGSTILALGGGVISDLAGFSAATYMRGCNWAVVPTTVLAMVDASLGGKTGCDLPQGKNLAGAFYPPKVVLADPDVLSTLPKRDLLAGLAEAVKHGIIGDPELFMKFSPGIGEIKKHLQEIICRAIAVKVRIIEEDPFEKGIRASLNFGHTIGHAVEALSGYRLLHGEAVSIGMVVEAKFAEKMGIAEKGLAGQITTILKNLELPTEIPQGISNEDLVVKMRTDKKKSGGIVRFALPEKIGSVATGVEIKEIEQLLENIR